MKKGVVFLFMMVILAASASAQPTTLTWQGKLLDASGNAITQNNVTMSFAMFDAFIGGNQLWPVSGVVTKTVNVVQGLYSVQLGTGIGDDIAFTAAMFNGKTPWLEVKVGTEKLPRTEITNVPFALISNDLSAAGWENPGEIGKTTPNTGKFTTLESGSLKVTSGASLGKVLTSDADGNASWQSGLQGSAPGQMQYWNGTAWVTVAAGKGGQTLIFTNGSPLWVYEYAIINHLSVGDYYQGGIIAYFLQSGDPGYDANVRHGIIAAPGDQSSPLEWYNGSLTTTGANGTAIGTGNANTNAIVASQGSGSYAAKVCNDLILNGYSDWYLPSKDELYKLYLNKTAVGGFASAIYWSSTESDNSYAWLVLFDIGFIDDGPKDYQFYVRAIRAF
jgi:hypothetical protein